VFFLSRVNILNSITIGSAIFAGLMIVTDRLHYSVCSNRPHLASAVMRPNPDDSQRLLLRTLLRNLLQQQKSARNHAKVQLQQNAQQTWLQVKQTMLF